MSRRPSSKRPEREEHERPTRHPGRTSSGSWFGLAVVLFVVAGAVVLFSLTQKKVEADAPAVVETDPFADLPPEAPPEKQAKTKGELQRDEQKQREQK